MQHEIALTTATLSRNIPKSARDTHKNLRSTTQHIYFRKFLPAAGCQQFCSMKSRTH